MAAGRRRELIEIEERKIREGVGLQVAPYVLDRIKLRRVRRKELGRELRMRREELLHAIRAMGIEPVPDENHGPVDLSREMPEKADDTLGVDVRIRMEAEVEVNVAAIGGHAQRPNGGHLAMGAATMVEQGSFASWAPRAPHERRHHQATLVEEGEPRFAPGRFF